MDALALSGGELVDGEEAFDDVGVEREFGIDAKLTTQQVGGLGDRFPLFDISVSYEGSDSRVYTDGDTLAVPPDSMGDQPNVTNGGTVEGNFAIEVPADVATGGLLSIEQTLSLDNNKVYWRP